MPVACTRRGRRLASALNVASEHQSPGITARFAATTTTRKRDSGRSKGLRLACVVIAVEQRKPTDRDVGNRILIKRVQMKFVREVVFGHAASLTVSDDAALNFAGQHLLKQCPVHRADHQRLPRPAQLRAMADIEIRCPCCRICIRAAKASRWCVSSACEPRRHLSLLQSRRSRFPSFCRPFLSSCQALLSTCHSGQLSQHTGKE